MISRWMRSGSAPAAVEGLARRRLAEVGLGELAGRDVDRDVERRAGRGSRRCQRFDWRHASSRTQVPIGHDQAGLLEGGMNSAGPTMPRVGVDPAQQGLDADERAWSTASTTGW